MGDVIVVAVIALAAGLAARYIWKSRRSGKCVGCKGCSGGCTHSQH